MECQHDNPEDMSSQESSCNLHMPAGSVEFIRRFCVNDIDIGRREMEEQLEIHRAPR